MHIVKRIYGTYTSKNRFDDTPANKIANLFQVFVSCTRIHTESHVVLSIIVIVAYFKYRKNTQFTCIIVFKRLTHTTQN